MVQGAADRHASSHSTGHFMTDAAFDPHDVDDMTRPPTRWHEPTPWTTLQHRLDHATKAQLMALAHGGIGEPEQ